VLSQGIISGEGEAIWVRKVGGVGRVLPRVAGFAREKVAEHRNLGDATTRYCCKGYLHAQSTPSQKWVRAYFLSYIKIIQLSHE
jgi:hypothetical protein